MKWAAIIVAAGSGTRFGQPKQLIDIAGEPMVAWSMRAFEAIVEVSDLVIATEPAHIEAMTELAARHAPRLTCVVTRGGVTRQESVRAALALVPDCCEGVFVHDGARPLVRTEDVREGMRAVKPGVAALLAAPVVDTIKVVENGKVTRTLDRRTLWAAQTPQFALTSDLRNAYAQASREGVGSHRRCDAFGAHRPLTVTAIPSASEEKILFKVTHPLDRDRARRRSCALVSRKRRGVRFNVAFRSWVRRSSIG